MQINQPYRQTDWPISMISQNKEIFQKLDIRINLDWKRTNNGIYVKVRELSKTSDFGKAYLLNNQTVTFSGAVNEITQISIQVRFSSLTDELLYQVKAIYRPTIGNWRCISTEEKRISL